MKQLHARSKQALETRKKILETALISFDEKGYDKLTIRNICENANISIGTFYHHFKSKEDIIDSVYDSFDYLLEETFGSTVFPSFHEGLHALINLQISQIESKGAAVVSQLFQAQLSDGSKYIINENRYFYLKLLELATNGIKKKEIALPLSAKEIVELILRLTRGGIYDWSLHNGSYPLKDTILFDLTLLFPKDA